ncbi:MAG: tRNA (adenosine(37)-N6)-threonylcarbamoyltransferase complex dimerization subunit type 1 TsaB, partial [Spirochaetales bacterium]|nr:tRNA (adenosine(37)-N6)-threonylcarbamoyltransferase complex dimerization subunit type 1 TsaB [Spirochaetales bacterium]
MKVLFFDSSTEILIVGLTWQDGHESRMTWRSEKTGLNHAQKILRGIEEIFEETQTEPTELNALACTLGPGSFTGLRIGLCTAKGLAEGWNLPIVGVSALEAMAKTAFLNTPREQATWLPVIDARKGRFYTQEFVSRGAALEAPRPPLDLTPEDFLIRWQDRPAHFCGYQAALLAEKLKGNWPTVWSVQQGSGWEAALGQLALEALETPP